MNRLAQRPTDMRRHNLSLVMRLIRHNEGISRSELSQHLGLTRAALTHLVAELIDLGLVVESGADSSAVGRPRTKLKVNSELYASIGIVCSRERLRLLMCDLRRDALREYEYAMPDPPVPEQIADLIVEAYRHAASDTDRSVIGVGIALPVTESAAQLLNQPDWGWEEVDLLSLLKQRGPNLPKVSLVNIAQAAALANAMDLNIQGRILHVQIGQSISMGMVINQHLTANAPQWGQIGHAPIADGDNPCTCGQTTCTNAFLGVSALVRNAAKVPIKMSKDPDRVRQFANALYALARSGNDDAQAAIDEAEDKLVRVLVLLAQIGGPEALTYDGYPTFFGKDFQEKVAERVAKATQFDSPLKMSRLGDEAAVLGAVHIGAENGLIDPCGCKTTS